MESVPAADYSEILRNVPALAYRKNYAENLEVLEDSSIQLSGTAVLFKFDAHDIMSNIDCYSLINGIVCESAKILDIFANATGLPVWFYGSTDVPILYADDAKSHSNLELGEIKLESYTTVEVSAVEGMKGDEIHLMISDDEGDHAFFAFMRDGSDREIAIRRMVHSVLNLHKFIEFHH